MATNNPGSALRVGLLLALSLSGCGTAASGQATDQHGAASGATPVIQSCQGLIDTDWTAPAGDPSFVVDPETWIVEVEFGEDDILVVDLLNDPACAMLPDIGGPLSRIIPEYEQIRIEDCTDAVADVIGGRAPNKGPATTSLDALRQYVVEWCPSTFADRLPPA